ncbi:MAG: SMP-30/gluconolactonase/LRE family protein [Chloroflexi bacterium]|nr:SMP-30/gluconolactonase/LRE family protein [Chloroflexota bacterium]
MAWEFEMVAGPFNPRLTEGPAWDGRYLFFTHIPKSLILRYDPQTGECRPFREHTNHTNGLAYDSEGRLYGCCSGGRSFVRFEPNGTTTTIVDRLDGAPLNTPNDLAIDRQGRIWFSNAWNVGNIAPSEKEIPGRNCILRADPQPDGTWVCKRMTHDTTGSNGLLISPDQRKLYMIQTSPELRELRAYDIVDDGSLGKHIVLHQFGTDYRGPHRGIDGMCLDSEGNIVGAAGSHASGPGPMIYIWDPNGRVLETHPMPVGVDGPTNCTFGDPDLRSLYVTTAGGHLLRVRNTGRRGWLMWPPAR